MGAGGRPTDYKEEYADQAYKLCLLGHTDKELASFFDVCEATINNWKKEYPAFLESLKSGKEIADAEVVASLFQRAKGYSHPEDKIFLRRGGEVKHDEGVEIKVTDEVVVVPTTKHYPPDAVSAIYWLNNRQRAKWKKEGGKDALDDKKKKPLFGRITLRAPEGD